MMLFSVGSRTGLGLRDTGHWLVVFGTKTTVHQWLPSQLERCSHKIRCWLTRLSFLLLDYISSYQARLENSWRPEQIKNMGPLYISGITCLVCRLLICNEFCRYLGWRAYSWIIFSLTQLRKSDFSSISQ